MGDASSGLRFRRLPVALTVVLAALSAVVGSVALVTPDAINAVWRSDDASVRDFSAAHLYGYTSAALTACPLKEGPAWGAFERTLAEERAKNALLSDVSEGFATFDRDASTHGLSTICDQALNLYGTGNSEFGFLLSTSAGSGYPAAPLRSGY